LGACSRGVSTATSYTFALSMRFKYPFMNLAQLKNTRAD
jgi:hypothetical protein